MQLMNCLIAASVILLRCDITTYAPCALHNDYLIVWAIADW